MVRTGAAVDRRLFTADEPPSDDEGRINVALSTMRIQQVYYLNLYWTSSPTPVNQRTWRYGGAARRASGTSPL
jgi:hypothetical protein